MIKSIGFAHRPDNRRATPWKRRLIAWLQRHAPDVSITTESPDLLIVLGGDGTILEAAHTVSDSTSILGLNLGSVGFLASVRDEKHFEAGLRAVLRGKYRITPRMTLDITVRRGSRAIATNTCLNEVYIQHPLGMVGIDVIVDTQVIQHIQGTGVLVATPTGSTGYNLSAHGPIIDPSLACIIVTEILDHNLPTPSIVLPPNHTVTLSITGFRKRGTLTLTGTNKPADVLLAIDGQSVIALEPHDKIIITKGTHTIRTIEIEPHYFYTSLREKFSLT